MSEQITILHTNRLTGWLQTAFERWRDKYLMLASAVALFLAAPLAFGSLSTIIFRTNLSRQQTHIFLISLISLSALNGLLVFLNIYILSPNARLYLRQDQQEHTTQRQILAWQEVARLPNRVVWSIGVTTFITYVLPIAAIMRQIGHTTVDESIYITLSLILAGINLLISANLIFRLFLMPVYNYLAPVKSDVPIEQIAIARMRSDLIFQSTAITLIILLILDPRWYYQITELIYRGAFYQYPLRQIRLDMIIITLAAILISVLYSAVLSYVLSTPARHIVEAILRIQQGETALRAPVTASDEIGQIAIYLNRLLDQTQTLQKDLQNQVEERTQALTQRTTELQAITEIAQKTADFENVSELLDSLVQIIPEYFGFYHVGLFILDKSNGYAVLQAANSPGGQKMLARGHRLRIGEGIVGTAAQQRKARIALDVGTDAIFFNNPDLPDTRSEMALPLIVRGDLVGVLDIQSTQPNAFNYEDLEILQTLANQVGLAIENTRLLEESRQALRELQTFIQQDLLEQWRARSQRQAQAITYTGLGYKSSGLNENESGFLLEIPVSLQGIRLGTLKLRRRHRPWDASEQEMAQQIGQQIALALESARLLDTTRSFVEREQTISQISSRMRQSLELDAVLRTTVNELQRNLGLAEAEIQLVASDEDLEKRD